MSTLKPSAPSLRPSGNRILLAKKPVAEIERELVALPHLKGDLRSQRKLAKVIARETIQARTATEAIGEIPGEGQSLHIIASGRFALWDCVPAILELSGANIDRLSIATLGFSKRNVAGMAELVDAGRIGSVSMLFSHYFRGTSSEITGLADQEFGARPDKMRLLSVRIHCKILLIEISDGRKIVVESSANLRSCKNIEQITFIADGSLHDFHLAWMNELFSATGVHRDR